MWRAAVILPLAIGAFGLQLNSTSVCNMPLQQPPRWSEAATSTYLTAPHYIKSRNGNTILPQRHTASETKNLSPRGHTQTPVIIYSDAEWTVLENPPRIKKGLGGILWQPGELPCAAAVDTLQALVDALSPRKTQIIPLELMAAAGMLVTYGHLVRGEDVIFFIDNQSVCWGLVKGCSRSWDIQLLSTCWQLLCLQLGCRVWIEWVPSESNPTDVLSREGTTDEATKHGNVETLKLPPWADVKANKDIKQVFDSI